MNIVHVIAVAAAFPLMAVTVVPGNGSTTLTPEERREKAEDYIHKEIVEAFNDADGVKVTKWMISRCPSGYDAWPENVEAYQQEDIYGEVSYANGCQRVHIADFHVNPYKKVAELRSKETKEFVAANTWLSAHEDELASNVVDD